MKATKLPSGNYRAIAYLGTDEKGRRLQKSFTAPDAKRAIALASAYEDENRFALDVGTLGDCMRKFLHDRQPFLSPTTYAEYYSRYHVLTVDFKRLCKKRLISITSDDLRALTSNLTVTRGLAVKTVRNYIIFLSAVYRFCDLQMPSVDLPKRQPTDLYIPTDAEVKALIEESKDSEMYVPVLLAAFGPLRRGEICGLDAKRDIKGNVIHVKEAVVTGIGSELTRKSPKTVKSDRFIEMPDFVIGAITDQGYVTHLTPNAITHQFPTLLKRAGLPSFRFHDLRHYCVSTLHAQGVATASIVKRCGHSSDQMIQRVYRHILADQDERQTRAALDHFSRVFHTGG